MTVDIIQIIYDIYRMPYSLFPNTIVLFHFIKIFLKSKELLLQIRVKKTILESDAEHSASDAEDIRWNRIGSAA